LKDRLNNIISSNGFNYEKDGVSIYMKLHNAIAKAIIEKKLPENYQLPPTRILAQDLKLSRSTVLKAYEILCAEKYVTSMQGSGYFVNDVVEYKEIQDVIKTNIEQNNITLVSKRALQFKKSVRLMNRGKYKGIAFRPGLPPLDVFPVKQWQSLTNNYWKNVTFSDLSYRHTLGLDHLRKNIVAYLNIYRNIQCDYRQIVIVTGSLHSLSILGDLFLDENDEVVLENPTYANAIALFKSLNAKIIPAKIDKEGLSIDSIKNIHFKKSKLIFTTPSNQYPTGVQMSLNRRLEVLDWATKNNCLVIEDDYDHEFSNWDNPIPSIFSLDKGNRVIYQGTFNKLLHPSIRLGYLIVPKNYIEDIKAMYEQSLRFVSPVTQQVMSDFIEKDYLSQHLRKVIKISNERKVFFTNCFKKIFKNDMKLYPVNNGLHFIVKLPDHMNDVKVSDFLGKNEIVVFPYSKYFFKGKKGNGLLIGFSSVSKPIIKRKLEKMYQLLKVFNEPI
jgi:GntR family transcriptional regulator/MocR family aminotransferase